MFASDNFSPENFHIEIIKHVSQMREFQFSVQISIKNCFFLSLHRGIFYLQLC